MSRGSSVTRLGWVQAALGTSNPVSPPQSLLGGCHCSFTIRQTPGSSGTLAGNAQVQVTDFGGGPGGSLDVGQAPLTNDWVNQGTAVAVAGGATIRVSLPNQTGKFIRFTWADTGSTTATLDAAITISHFVDD